MKKISIKKEYSEDRTSRIAGERLRETILQAHKNGEKVELDFSNLKVASTSFFDEGIAKLAEEGWDEKTVTTFVQLKGIHRLDLKILRQVCAYRGLDLWKDL